MLAGRIGAHIDDQKRIDSAAQLARALVRIPELRDPSRLPPQCAALLHRLASAGGDLLVETLPAGLEPLVFKGLVFARWVSGGLELVLPTAFLLQLEPAADEDPRSLRVLLASASFEAATAIASHYLGRPATPPMALSLEAAWEVLSDPGRRAAEVQAIAWEERKLLEAIERLGGEVDNQELMDLERGPMRVRSGGSALTTGRRGAAFSLQKRGLLFALPPNRYVVPSEVAAVVGAERLRQREAARSAIRLEVRAQDHLPRRARFAACPAGLATAMAIILQESPADVRSGVGTPRSLISRLAQRIGRDVDATALLAAASRAVGLWELGSDGAAVPPWSWSLDELAQALFAAWLRGSVWDEARSDPELLRATPDTREPSPIRVVKEMALAALRELGESHWVPAAAIRAYVLDDPQTPGLERLFVRWAARTGGEPPRLGELVERVITDSLPALGVVDTGEIDAAPVRDEREERDGGRANALAVRLTARGRALIRGDLAPRGGEEDTGEFVDPDLLCVGRAARVGEILAVAQLATLAGVAPQLSLRLNPSTLARGLASGLEVADMRRRVEAFGTPPRGIAEALQQASAVLGRATFVASVGFLWVDDPDVRELLRTRLGPAELLLEPSPPAGLLIAPGVDPERLVRACRALGVEVQWEGVRWQARRTTRPPPRTSQTTQRRVSWRPPAEADEQERDGTD